MREQNYLDRAKLNPASTFKSPMDVVETDDIDLAAKLAILKGKPMSELFCAPKTKGWVEASMRIFTRCKRPLPNLARTFARPRPSGPCGRLECWSRLLGVGWATKFHGSEMTLSAKTGHS
jgi:hypothetical protein